MAILQIITVKESSEELEKLYSKSSYAVKPRLKMLLLILQGTVSTQELVSKTKANRDSIRNWKNTYLNSGIEGLLKETRGGKRPSAIKEHQKLELKQKLSERTEGFTSYIQAMDWINEKFNLDMNYQAVNKYLKRHFGTKLKVGRKSHVNKDENAAALFKKTV
jgi:transposase